MQWFAFISPILFSFIVILLGFMTPGYNHLNHTISRLAIEQYGWIQIANFIQLAAGLFVTGNTLSKRMKKNTIIQIVFTAFSAFIFMAAIFPTDPIENVPLDLSLLSPNGLVHSAAVILCLLLSPLGIIALAHEFYRFTAFRTHAIITLIAGFSAFIGSIFWFIFFALGLYLEYRGIFQKILVVPVLVWLSSINSTLYRNR